MNELKAFRLPHAKAILSDVLAKRDKYWTRHEVAQVEYILKEYGYQLPDESQYIDVYIENLRRAARAFVNPD